MDELSSLLSQAFEVVKGFKDAGLLVGLMGTITLLVNVTKISVVEKWLSGIKPLRSLVAVGLGLAGGLVTSLVQGKSWGEVALMVAGGALAGLGGVGVHEVVGALKPLGEWLKGLLGLSK